MKPNNPKINHQIRRSEILCSQCLADVYADMKNENKFTTQKNYEFMARIEQLENERDEYEEALQRIAQWSDAYPLEVFPEPDFKKAHEALKTAGMTLDAISDSNIRYAVRGVGEIAKKALKE